MSVYYTLGMAAFVIAAAALLIRYVHINVDREFRNLARADSDTDFRDAELKRVDALLDSQLPVPESTPPLSGPGAGLFRVLPLVLFAIGTILVWGGVFAREEKPLWLYAGLGSIALSVLFMLVSLGRRKWERTARLLRFRADLRRMDGNRKGAAADLRELLRLTPWDDAAWAELSDDLAAEGVFPDALDAMREAGRLDPQYDEYKMLESSLALRLKRFGEARDAIDAWQRLAGEEKRDPRIAIYRAAVDLASGNRSEAEDSVRELLRDDDGECLDFIESDKALSDVKTLLQ